MSTSETSSVNLNKTDIVSDKEISAKNICEIETALEERIASEDGGKNISSNNDDKAVSKEEKSEKMTEESKTTDETSNKNVSNSDKDGVTIEKEELEKTNEKILITLTDDNLISDDSEKIVKNGEIEQEQQQQSLPENKESKENSSMVEEIKDNKIDIPKIDLNSSHEDIEDTMEQVSETSGVKNDVESKINLSEGDEKSEKNDEIENMDEVEDEIESIDEILNELDNFVEEPEEQENEEMDEDEDEDNDENENEEDNHAEPAGISSANAILIDDDDEDEDDDEEEEDDGHEDEDDEEIDEDDDDEEVEDENNVDDEEANEEIEDDDDEDVEDDDEDDDDDEVQEILSDSDEDEDISIKGNKSTKNIVEILSTSASSLEKTPVKKRPYSTKFRGSKIIKRKMRAGDWNTYFKKRSIKWLAKRMHVMESDKMVTAVGNKTSNSNEEKIRSANKDIITKDDDEGIQIIEDKDEIILTKSNETLVTSENKENEEVVTNIKNEKSIPGKIINEEIEIKNNDTCNLNGDKKNDAPEDIEMVESNVAVDLSPEKVFEPEKTTLIEIKNENNDDLIKENVSSNKINITESLENNDSNLVKTLSIETAEKNVIESFMRSQKSILENKLNSSRTDSSNKLNVNDEKESISDKENLEKEYDNSESGVKKIQTQSGAIKRTLSPTSHSLDYSNPSKKHCDEVQPQSNVLISNTSGGSLLANYENENKILNEFMDKSSNDSPDELKKHILEIEQEIHGLNEVLKVKEEEWNNMLHLKKIKEEILERLTRRKRINDIRSVLSVGNENQTKTYNKTNSAVVTNAANIGQTNTLTTANLTNSNNILTSNVLPTGFSTTSILQCRANMKSEDLVKEKINTQRLHRNILPKNSTPYIASTNQQNKILNYTTSNLNHHPQMPQQQQHHPNIHIPKKLSIHQQQQNDYLNGHNNNSAMGRQGAIKDVQSIIADYRQKHPEQVPRRGRRLRPSFSINDLSGGDNGGNGNSRPSSADSSHSNSNSLLTSTPQLQQQHQQQQQQSNVSFKDVLVKFAKMTPTERQKLNAGNSASLLSTLNLNSPSTKAPPPPYPEVTLHPLNSTHSEQNPTGSGGTHTNSLLHGILTKTPNRSSSSAYNSFSPTLARLLTAPERITPQAGTQYHHPSTAGSQNLTTAAGTSTGVNLIKGQNEITITPVVSNLFPKREETAREREFNNRMKPDPFADDEADDSVDRLVIDEDSPAVDQHQANSGQEFHENEVPECQGCKKREAQFVCAGCGNQWYCSRECQVRAWDEHSDVCTG